MAEYVTPDEMLARQARAEVIYECRQLLKLRDQEIERLRAALVQIKAQSGAVCPTFEVCTHPWCEASCAAWMLADEALSAP